MQLTLIHDMVRYTMKWLNIAKCAANESNDAYV